MSESSENKVIRTFVSKRQEQLAKDQPSQPTEKESQKNAPPGPFRFPKNVKPFPPKKP